MSRVPRADGRTGRARPLALLLNVSHDGAVAGVTI